MSTVISSGRNAISEVAVDSESDRRIIVAPSCCFVDFISFDRVIIITIVIEGGNNAAYNSVEKTLFEWAAVSLINRAWFSFSNE